MINTNLHIFYQNLMTKIKQKINPSSFHSNELSFGSSTADYNKLIELFSFYYI